jgi:hypothetical protein
METMLIQEFRADHQRIRGTLLRLHRAILEGDVPLVRTILGSADTLLGAHFKFEERYLYPALSGFLGDDGVQQMLREHDSIFRGVGDLIGLAQKPAWAETERAAALESLGLVGDHPENCDNLCRHIEGLPTTEQESLLAEMRRIRQERPEFSAYGIERHMT